MKGEGDSERRPQRLTVLKQLNFVLPGLPLGVFSGPGEAKCKI